MSGGPDFDRRRNGKVEKGGAFRRNGEVRGGTRNEGFIRKSRAQGDFEVGVVIRAVEALPGAVGWQEFGSTLLGELIKNWVILKRMETPFLTLVVNHELKSSDFETAEAVRRDVVVVPERHSFMVLS